METMLLTLKLRPSPRSRRALMDILRHVKGPTLDQPGCLECEIYDGADDVETVLLFERWESEQSLVSHLGSPLYQQVLTAMELSETEPEIACHTIAGTRGMDLIRQLRQPTDTRSHHTH